MLLISVPNFTSSERILVKSIVGSLYIKRIPDVDIINHIFAKTKNRRIKG